MDQVTAEVRKVIIGQEDAIRYSLVAILCNQHALIEGVPGLAKTLLARTLAAVHRLRSSSASSSPPT